YLEMLAFCRTRSTSPREGVCESRRAERMPARRLIAISMAVVLALPALAAGAKGSCGTTPGCCCARVARAPAPTSRGCCEMAPGAKPESLGQVSSHQARGSRPDAPSHLSVAPSRQNAPKHGG